MRQVHVLVEGTTEERVVLQVLQPELTRDGVWLTPVVLKTRRAAGRPHNRGGVSRWSKIEPDIRALLRNPSVDLVTTMLDFYGLPADTPGQDNLPERDAYDRVAHLETGIADSINDERFLPFLVLHETEAWVLAAAEQLAYMLDAPKIASTLKAQVARCGGPELVDDGPDTAPSKRIAKAWPDYRKVIDGPDALELLGLADLRAACPHLDAWLTKLTAEPTPEE